MGDQLSLKDDQLSLKDDQLSLMGDHLSLKGDHLLLSVGLQLLIGKELSLTERLSISNAVELY